MVFPWPLVVTHSKHQGPFLKSEPIKINMTGQYHPHGIMSAFHWMYAVSLKALKGLRHNACTSSHHINLKSHESEYTSVWHTSCVKEMLLIFMLVFKNFYWYYFVQDAGKWALCSYCWVNRHQLSSNNQLVSSKGVGQSGLHQ